jgi:hypothetical protein
MPAVILVTEVAVPSSNNRSTGWPDWSLHARPNEDDDVVSSSLWDPQPSGLIHHPRGVMAHPTRMGGWAASGGLVFPAVAEGWRSPTPSDPLGVVARRQDSPGPSPPVSWESIVPAVSSTTGMPTPVNSSH